MPEINPWAVFVSAFFTALPIVLALVLSHIRQMAGIVENTQITKDVAKVTVDQNAKVVNKAEEAVVTAKEVADTTQKDLGEIKHAVVTVTKALNGEGVRAHEEGYAKGLIEGSRLLTLVNANTERIDVIDGRLESFDGRIKHVEENTEAILTMLRIMQPVPTVEKIQERMQQQ